MSRAQAQSDLQATLTQTERCVSAVSQALLHARPDAMESTSRDLHQSSLALSGLLQGIQGKSALDQHLRQRLGKLVLDIALQREGLLRRSAAVERSLHSIVPATRAPTYSSALGPYARNGRQGGAFRAC